MRKLEVGSGTRPTPGYDHADANPNLPHLEYVCEMDSIPVADGSYDEVRTVHVIEHVGIPRAKKALKEWFRVLRRGGMVYVDTPNIALNAKLYVDAMAGGTKWVKYFNALTDGEREMCSIEGKPDPTLWVNFKVFSTDDAWNTHYWNADPRLLSAMLQEAGFGDIRIVQEDPSVIVTGRKL